MMMFQIPHHQNQNFKELLLCVKNKHFCLDRTPLIYDPEPASMTTSYLSDFPVRIYIRNGCKTSAKQL